MTFPRIPRVVWITGAEKGIGRELAKRYAADGWIVAASARRAGKGVSTRRYKFRSDVGSGRRRDYFSHIM